MAKKAPQAANKKVVHPSFNIPEGLTSLVNGPQKDDQDDGYTVDDSGQQLIDNTLSVDIVSQTLRMSNDGGFTVLVDVILEVDDVNGSDKFEIRVAPAE